jgi:hypothetical protein
MQTLQDLKTEKIRLCKAGYNAADLVATIQLAAVDPNTGELIEGEFWLSKNDPELKELFNNLAARLIGENLMLNDKKKISGCKYPKKTGDIVKHLQIVDPSDSWQTYTVIEISEKENWCKIKAIGAGKLAPTYTRNITDLIKIQ